MISRIELDNKPVLQLLLILSLCLISVILFSIVGGLLTVIVFDVDLTSLNNYGNPKVIEALKLFQLLSAIGFFIVPPLIYGFVSSKNPFQKLSLKPFNHPINYLLILLLMIVSTPFLSWVIELNASMSLPHFMNGIEQWMQSSEKQAAELTNVFLTFNGMGSLFYILIIVAVVPALGEELLFRGVLQKIFINWTKNPHIGIWITATLFSALHMQFFGFFPRLLLGLMFGYLFWWSKSLWLPILGHFINNGSVVFASYFYPESIKDADISVFEGNENSIIFYILSVVLTAFILLVVRKINVNKKEFPEQETFFENKSLDRDMLNTHSEINKE